MVSQADIWMDKRFYDADEGRTEMMAYVAARVAGSPPEKAASQAGDFVSDAKQTWTAGFPTRRELFATVERTLLVNLPERETGSDGTN